MRRTTIVAGAVVLGCFSLAPAYADSTVFFSSCQVATVTAPGVSSDTITSNGYRFTYTRDKLFTGGTGQPIVSEAVLWSNLEQGATVKTEGLTSKTKATTSTGTFDAAAYGKALRQLFGATRAMFATELVAAK
jgi:hypothetical protein